MRRRIARPFGSSIPATRTLSLLVSMAVIGALYSTAREASSWRWLEVQAEEAGTAPAPPPAASAETIVAGPNDLDPAEFAKFMSLDELVSDRTQLRQREMIAYWQLVGWSRTQSQADLEKRAQSEPALTQLWAEPENYRGKLLRLRLNVRRVLKYTPSENPLGVTVCYEAMGWTDESKSIPYTVVFTELPPGLPVGAKVESEVIFVGYFFKIMTYQTFDDKARGTPLLMGRLRSIAPQKAGGPPPATSRELAIVGMLGAVLIGGVILLQRKKKRPVRPHSNAGVIDSQWVPIAPTDPTSVGLLDEPVPSLQTAPATTPADTVSP
ncbi:MAG: hypothetical protein DWH91_00285 [Planctomycetota bacterium]|nr:MAG: hypothetical protein DWH91_00285 [Planctomycetota bacterium]